jgi:tetratricopeptide (TPR) repeat protein
VNPEGWKRAKELFSAALGLPETEREAFLEAQRDEREILDEVRSLLATYRDSPDFLENAAPALLAELRSRESAIPFAGRRIGAWELVREIGQGGMGLVWEARRADQQYEQRAAVKLLRASLFSEQDVRRFREERQILASLNHPCIARLLDGGMLEDGEPYLVMEYIDGVPLNGWCELHKPSLRQRIALCLEICSAVEYAHRHLVIHRDLKSANILVGGDGTPKLLDFGIAKLVPEGGSYRTTANLLSPECASPEQARGERMTTASDQFSLGVLLYQLLTGRHPFAAPDVSPIEALRAICEDEPRLPSSVAENWSRELRGELDAILLQALNKNPAVRYASVSAFAGDLRAWLGGLPVSAVRESRWRRSAKLVLRYKALSAAIATAVMMLMTGILVTSIEARRALRAEREALAQRDRAENSQQTAQLQRDRAVAAEKAAAQDRDRALSAERSEAAEKDRAVAESRRADNEAATTRNINDFLEKDLLAQGDPKIQANPERKPDPDLKVRTALDRAAERIQGKFAGEPLIEASIRQTIGESYYDLGLYAEAQRQWERVVELRRKFQGDDASETLGSMRELAVTYRDQALFTQAEPLLKQIVKVQQAKLGANDNETLSSALDLAALYYALGRYPEVEAMMTHILQVRRQLYPDKTDELFEAIYSLATTYGDEGKYAAAEPLAQEALGIARRLHGDDHPDTLKVLRALVVINRWKKDFAQAEKLQAAALAGDKRTLGADNPHTQIDMNNLAVIYRIEGRFAESESLLEQLHEISRRVNGEENLYTLAYETSLTQTMESLGQFAEAEPLAKKNLETLRRVYGEDNTWTITSTRTLGLLYCFTGRFKEAEALLQRTVDATRRVLGAEHVNLATAATWLGILYQDEGKTDLAEQTLTEAVALDRKRFQPGELITRSGLTSLGRLRLAEQRYSEAESLLREAGSGEGNQQLMMWDTCDRQSLLGASLLGQGKYAEAEPLLIEGYEGLRKLSPAISVDANLPEAGQRLVQLYTAWGKPEKAAEWRQRLERPEK